MSAREGITCFIHNGGWYLTHLQVDKYGRVQYWGPHTFEEFLKDVISGWVGVDIPDGEELRIGDIGDFKVTLGKTLNPDGSTMFTHKWMARMDFVAEVADLVRRETGKQMSGDAFDEAWREFNAQRSESNRVRLKMAYLRVPAHKRRFLLGDQDLKDGPILSAIGEDLHRAPTLFEGL